MSSDSESEELALIVVASSVVALGLAVLLIHFFLIPLDALWFRALRWLQVYVPALASNSGPPEIMRYGMERIKEAVERARQERGASGIGFGRSHRTGICGRRPAARMLPTESSIRRRLPLRSRVSTLREKRIVSGFDPCGFTEAFKILSTQVSQALRQHHWTTLAVTSPNEREGKTLVAINLAISLAMEFHQTALLVEADLRQPSMCDYFGLESWTWA